MINIKRNKFDSTESYKALEQHYEVIKSQKLGRLFKEDKDRAQEFRVILEDLGLYFDYSKNLVDRKTMELLFSLAREQNINEFAEAMFSGAHINWTEDRAVLHTALRNTGNTEVLQNGKNVMPEINAVLQKMKEFSDGVRKGRYTGCTGKKICDVVNIGIGGSDLGPKMVCRALTAVADGPRIHFVSNIDAADINNVLSALDPETVLFIVASKTFTTQETMTNAQSAKKWLIEELGPDSVKKQFIALSTNTVKVNEFGIDSSNIFRFWDFVGGRYSLWSAIGLSIMLNIGYERFRELLEGANMIDRHFISAEPERNIPVIMGLLGVWYNNFYNCDTFAVLPYSDYLSLLPAYLQQADMESNGKSIDFEGGRISYQTGPVLWGEAGTNGQHSFYQLIHQGTKLIPSDFIGFINSHDDISDHHNKLMSNFFAQTEALAFGLSEDDVISNMQSEGADAYKIDLLAPHRTFEGSRPTNTLLFNELTPRTLGALVAMYEHKIFVQGIIWGINSFDQWGVELGKKMAGVILKDIESKTNTDHDPSTENLIKRFLDKRQG